MIKKRVRFNDERGLTWERGSSSEGGSSCGGALS